MIYRSILLLSLCCMAMYAQHWIIVANGPAASPKELLEVWDGEPILALDGAANRLFEWGIIPTGILGDFDSIRDPGYFGIQAAVDSPYTGNQGILIIPAYDQDYTDLEKGIRFVGSHGASSITILYALDGRLDHTLGNLGLLRKYYQRERPIRIHATNEWIQYVRDQRVMLYGAVGSHCAINAFPEGFMTSRGLAYNGDHYHLVLGIQESVCNSLAEPEASIEIEGEALIQSAEPLSAG